METLLMALIMVESGGDCDAVGDNGKSLGCLQIQRPYFKDAVQQLAKEKHWGASNIFYDQVRHPPIAKLIARAYFRRHEPEAYRVLVDPDNLNYSKPVLMGAMEILARLHNGGPKWRKRDTYGYWQKVKTELEREK